MRQPVSELGVFEKQVKDFIKSKHTAEDFVKLLTTFEKTRNNKGSMTDIITILERLTETQVVLDEK